MTPTRLLSTFVILLCLLSVVLAISASRTMPVWISIGENNLRMLIDGTGSSAVVLETFGPAYLETWNRIQPGIAKFATVISYDHGGYWGSEPGPKPRDAKQIARELHAALHTAKIPPPYLLVGYSFGGPYTRVFASLYPDEVSGIVFVDPAQEEFMSWLNHHFLDMNVVTDADRKKQDEWGSQWASLDQAHSAVLPEVPITLITAMQSGGPLLQRLLPVWLQSHSNWLSQFPDARHIITTNSGHGIFFTEPDLVVKAVEEMLREGDARK